MKKLVFWKISVALWPESTSFWTTVSKISVSIAHSVEVSITDVLGTHRKEGVCYLNPLFLPDHCSPSPLLEEIQVKNIKLALTTSLSQSQSEEELLGEL